RDLPERLVRPLLRSRARVLATHAHLSGRTALLPGTRRQGHPGAGGGPPVLRPPATPDLGRPRRLRRAEGWAPRLRPVPLAPLRGRYRRDRSLHRLGEITEQECRSRLARTATNAPRHGLAPTGMALPIASSATGRVARGAR